MLSLCGMLRYDFVRPQLVIARLFGRFEMPAGGTEFSAKCNYAVVRRPDQPCENQMGWNERLLEHACGVFW